MGGEGNDERERHQEWLLMESGKEKNVDMLLPKMWTKVFRGGIMVPLTQVLTPGRLNNGGRDNARHTFDSAFLVKWRMTQSISRKV